MALLRAGIEQRAQFSYTTLPLWLMYCNGSWSATGATEAQVLATEVGPRTAITVNAPVWNVSAERLDITMTSTITPVANTTINRLAIMRGGFGAPGFYDGSFTSATQWTATTSHPFSSGDRVLAQGNLYTIASVSGPQVNFSGTTFTLGAGNLTDATGVVIEGSLVTPSQTLLAGSLTTINISAQSFSNV